jgi:dTMP kinase
MRGRFISIEGTEGAGKSTALGFIKSRLDLASIECIYTREPGGTPIAEQIRTLLLTPNPNDVMSPAAELLLMFAARAQHIHTCIQPTLHQGKWVVCDRYIDASYAYQGGGRGIDLSYIEQLDHHVVGSLYPDLTLLFDVPAELGLKRAAQRGADKDRIEQEHLDFFNRVRDIYLRRAKADSKRIKVIDAAQSIAHVEAQLIQILNQFLEEPLS